MSKRNSNQQFHDACNAALQRRKSTPDSLQSKRTFVDTLRDKQEWIVEELAFRNPSNIDSDKKWCYWAQCRLAEINSELILYTE